MDKKCHSCGDYKPTSNFHVKKQNRSGLNSYCKSCQLSKVTSVRKARTKQSRREERLKEKYNLTIETYNLMLVAQGSACKICFSTPSEPLHVDHNHETGNVRGLLCKYCNWILGFAKDKPSILKQAIQYLEENNENATHAF